MFTAKSMVNCASCAKGVTNLSGFRAEKNVWEGLPARDSAKRMMKSGMGFSKMFTQGQMTNLLEPAESKRVQSAVPKKRNRRVKSGVPNAMTPMLESKPEALTNISSNEQVLGLNNVQVNAS